MKIPSNVCPIQMFDRIDSMTFPCLSVQIQLNFSSFQFELDSFADQVFSTIIFSNFDIFQGLTRVVSCEKCLLSIFIGSISIYTYTYEYPYVGLLIVHILNHIQAIILLCQVYLRVLTDFHTQCNNYFLSRHIVPHTCNSSVSWHSGIQFSISWNEWQSWS